MLVAGETGVIGVRSGSRLPQRLRCLLLQVVGGVNRELKRPAQGQSPVLVCTHHAGRTALCPEMSLAPAAVHNPWPELWRVGPLFVRLDHVNSWLGLICGRAESSSALSAVGNR